MGDWKPLGPPETREFPNRRGEMIPVEIDRVIDPGGHLQTTITPTRGTIRDLGFPGDTPLEQRSPNPVPRG